MTDLHGLRDRLLTTLGLLCVLATLLLSSAGVRVVHAEDGAVAENLMSVDPALVAPAAPVPGVVTPPPTPPVAADDAQDRAGVPAVEIAPGVIVLNTRGYNYGPPVGEIDPAAIRHE